MIFNLKDYLVSQKKKTPFTVDIGHWELVHECFPKHSRMGTAGMKLDKETEEEEGKRGVGMVRSGNERKKSRPSLTSCLQVYLFNTARMK